MSRLGRRDLLRAVGALLAASTVVVAGGAQTAAATVHAEPTPLVLRDVRDSDPFPPGGGYETNEALAVLVRFVVVSHAVDEATSLEIARTIRLRGACELATLESFLRLLREAWAIHTVGES